jgi:hypothetical protein
VRPRAPAVARPGASVLPRRPAIILPPAARRCSTKPAGRRGSVAIATVDQRRRPHVAPLAHGRNARALAATDWLMLEAGGRAEAAEFVLSERRKNHRRAILEKGPMIGMPIGSPSSLQPIGIAVADNPESVATPDDRA